MAELTLVEGWTGPIDEILQKAGVAENLTGMTVALLLQKASGAAVDTAGDVTIMDAPAGKVRYSPDPTDLLAAETPHVARWQVTDGAGKVVFFPSEAGEVWTILPTSAPALQDNALLTLAELKAALNVKNNDQEVALAQLIGEISDATESFFGRRLKTRAYTGEYLYVKADRVLGCEWLDVEWPITALTLLEVDGTAQTIWMPGDAGSPEDKDVFVLEARDPKHGRDRIFRRGGWPIGALVKRTYTGGYGVVGPPAFPIPGDLKECVRSLAVDWYYTRTRQAEPVVSRSTAGETITYVNEALPRRFRALANAYRRWA
jgi:hypothetical protein